MEIFAPFIGIIGVLIGILLNEYYRKSRRIEDYAIKLFDKRLEAYEGLYKVIEEAYNIIQPLLEKMLDKEKRHAIVSEAIFKIANYTDENQLYLKDEVTVHCCTMFMSSEDVAALNSEVEKKATVNAILEDYKNAKQMIRKECGLTDVDNLLASMMNIKHDSPVIRYFRRLKKQK